MCISVTGVKLWNTLDNSLISCKNVHHFKKCYTDRLLNRTLCVRVLDYFANRNEITKLNIQIVYCYKGFFFNKCHNVFFFDLMSYGCTCK